MFSFVSFTFTSSIFLALLILFDNTIAFNDAFFRISLIPKLKVEKNRTVLFGGSWGKRVKEFTEEEFARDGGETRPFDAYEPQERGDFLRKLNNDRTKFLKRKDEDFLEIARVAGISDQSGQGVEPMGQFSVDEFDDEDIDVSV